ncbi:MAG TPA: hypothetical protein VME46_06035 [Acidimicrobiales bacterium]|nr:hypothetical protein [Acidimicrobiales bacterium]
MARTTDATGPEMAALVELTDLSSPWRRPPAWAAFFFELGWRAAVAHESGARSCSVLVPPIRSFAGAFAATGAVLGVAATAAATPGPDAHFSHLASLAPGTQLVVKMGQKIYNARLIGPSERPDGPCIKIAYDNMIHYLPKQQCHRAQVGAGGKRSLPSTAPRRRRPPVTGLLELFLDGAAGDFLSLPTVDTVLIGHASVLEQELGGVWLRVSGQDAPADATPLFGLLRASRFLPDGGIPRSLLLSDRVSEFAMPVEDTPHVVVFDGARAFSRYRSRFAASSWIAVLDRCSPAFAEGTEVANQEFATRAGPARFLGGMDAPPGTEWQAFERAT